LDRLRHGEVGGAGLAECFADTMAMYGAPYLSKT